MTYAVSAADLLALPASTRALVVTMPRSHLAPDPHPTATQDGTRVLPLSGDDTRVRRALYRAQVLALPGGRLRVYSASARGCWDVLPDLDAVARMRAQEVRHG